jgi:CubicO group peptidase (beta-lactamase class C family)
MIQDASVRAVRQRTVNFAAKRYVDMMFVSGLDRATADAHFRWRPLGIPAGLRARLPAGVGREAIAASAAAEQAHAAGRIVIETDSRGSRVTVRWQDASLGAVVGTAIARPGYGGILLGEQSEPRFEPSPIARNLPDAGLAWPVGQHVAPPPTPPPPFVAALDAFFASSAGLYAVVVASADRVLAERYSAFGHPDRATPSWSMTKAVTSTLIGRLIHEGWLHSVHDPVPAPLWGDPRGIHHLIAIDHLLRMRGGLGFPVQHEDGTVTLGFENSSVYQDGRDAFEAAQRSIVATIPGAVFRYINSGMNVLGAVIAAGR